MDLLEQLQIAEKVNEKNKMELLKMEDEKKSINHFDEVWISDLIAERDEERESKKIYMKQLEECKQRIKELEDKRDTANKRNTNDDDNPVQKKSCIQNHKIVRMNKEKGNTSTDSGIDVQSIEKLIEERVAVTWNAKQVKNHTGAINKNSSNEFTQMIYTNATPLDYLKRTPATIDDMRELNIIVHGLKEDSTDPVVKELFDTLKIAQHPETSTDRLGAKSPDKIRPIRITMESYERKQKLMSSLWRLKNGPEKFRKISITEDYTQDERREIKRWVDEAKRRTQEVDDGYVWKVRGSPRSKLRLVNMRI